MIYQVLTLALLVPAPAKAPAVPKPEGAVFALSECGDCRQAEAVVAGGPPGTFTATWNAFTTFDGFFRTFDVNGNGGPERHVGTLTKAVGVGATGAGGFVVGWMRPQEIYAQRLEPNGTPSGPAIRVNAGHSNSELDDDQATVAAHSDGGFLVAWDRIRFDSQVGRVLARRADAGGALGPEVDLGPAVGRTFPVACLTASGGSVVAWTLRREPLGNEGTVPAGIAFRRLAPDGSPVGEVVEALAPVEGFNRMKFGLACGADGGFALAWQTRRSPAKKGFDIVVQRFDAAGAKQGPPFRANGVVAGDQTFPALLYEKDKRLLVIWASAAGKKNEVRGRRISVKGKPAGPEFVLHKGTAGVTLPAVGAVGERGQFVVVWREGERLFGRVFRP